MNERTVGSDRWPSLQPERTPKLPTDVVRVDALPEGLVPRFFFHVHDDIITCDEDGQDCANTDAAREIAIKSARELICERVRKGQLFLHHYIAVTDENGAEQFRVFFRDAVGIEN